MNDTPLIRTFAPHEWGIYKDLRLRALADAPDAFGRTLAEEQARSDAEWSERLVTGVNSGWALPLLAEVDGRPVGLAWGRIEASEPDVANLYQMWVAPSHRRRGAGSMLLEAVIAWAKAKGANYLDLGVTYRDSPALRLYRRAGFKPVEKPHPFRPGSDLLGQRMRLDLRKRGPVPRQDPPDPPAAEPDP
jgi:GNAT superfamily N-acetyltransferase